MDVMLLQTPPESASRLNPNAPIFVPMASYQTVEDFSDQWWDLVHSSPWFRDYWLQDCFQDPQSDPIFSHNDDLILPDFDAFFDLYLPKQEKEKEEEEEKEKSIEKELITVGALKWSRSGRRAVEAPKNFEKVPKIVKNVKVSPRTINQPK